MGRGIGTSTERILLTQDPIGLAGGVNLYAYAGNNPIAFSDPYGLDCPPRSTLCFAIRSTAQILGTVAGFIGGGGAGLLEIASTGGLATPAAVMTTGAGMTGGLALGTAAGNAITNTLFRDGSEDRLRNKREIGSGRLKGYSRGNVDEPGGTEAAKEMFKKLTGRDPEGAMDRVVQDGKEVLYRATSKSGPSKVEVVDHAAQTLTKYSFPE